MADSTISFFLEKLTNLAIQEASLFGEVEGKITLLCNELQWMRLFLRQASVNRTSDERLALWVDQMRDVCFDAEDVVDDFMFKVDRIRQQRVNNLKCLRPLPQCIGFSDKLRLVHDLKARMENINITVEKILVNKSRYGIENPKDLEAWSFAKEKDLQPIQKVRVISDRSDEKDDIVGMQDGMQRVRCMLINEETEMGTTLARRVDNDSNVQRQFKSCAWVSESQEYRSGELLMRTANSVMNPTRMHRSFTQEEYLPTIENVRVVPDRNIGEADFVRMQSQVGHVRHHLLTKTRVVSIWGTGGQGKTTLARRVYNDGHVKQHFACRAWVSVSQEYRIGELLMRIANSVMILTPQQKRTLKESELGNMLRDFLKSKTYLIVLDDLWSPQVFVDLSSHFPPSNNSRVLITTRIPEVAQHAPSDQVYEMLPLDKVNSWELFLKKFFRVTTTKHLNVQSDLEELREVVEGKCKGSPLTIALLGGLLSRKQRTPEWKEVLQRITRHGDDQPLYLRILSWSYNDLPFYLKSCFLYCGLSPEDHEISTRKLISLWIAEGFIQKRGEETLEETAEDYLEELIQRSMIQVGKRRLDGRVKSCYIHDMVRDFIMLEVRQSKLFEVCQDVNFSTPLNPRRLSFHHHAINDGTFQRLNTTRLRSLFCFTTECLVQKCLDSLIQGSKLLTVLDLRGSGGINELPKKIGKLIHLKYLSLRVSSITRLPKSVRKLANLQTLDLRDSSIERLPHTIWKLRQLRELYVGSTGMVLNSFTGVGQLTNLQTLNIWMDGCLKEGDLGKLTQLRKLKIHSNTGFNLELMSFSGHTYLYKVFLSGRLNKLPDETKFYPPNLMELRLSCSELDEDPMPILQGLPNLRNLQLLPSSYVGRKMACSSNGFPSLESLTLSGLRGLKMFSLEEGTMPGLRSLKIKECPKMKGLLHGLLRLKNLQQVKLNRVNPKLLEEFKISGGEEFDKIHSITSVIHDYRDA